MSQLAVSDITVPALLDRLKKREWLVPEFQREFVWSSADVIELVLSILESRPIGMATLWEQGSEPAIPAEPIWIADGGDRTYFSTLERNPNSTAVGLSPGLRQTVKTLLMTMCPAW